MDIAVDRLDSALEKWAGQDIPVLRATAKRLTLLSSDADNLRYSDVALVLLADPLACLRVLVWLHEHRSARQAEHITTLENALMRMGTRNFLELMLPAPTLDEQLCVALDQRMPVVLGLKAVVQRASYAAKFARDWAARRRDLAYDEISTAALLHNLSELLLWLRAPRDALAIEALKRRKESMRTADVQRIALGFTLMDMQQKLQAHWGMSPLCAAMLDQEQSKDPRALNVVLAVNLARHLANGWHDAALPDDFRALGDLLAMPPQDAWDLVGIHYEALRRGV